MELLASYSCPGSLSPLAVPMLLKPRYLRAMVARVGRDTDGLAAEALNPRDSGARWCAGWLLAREGNPASRKALAAALRNEPVAENIRSFGLLLNGENPCS